MSRIAYVNGSYVAHSEAEIHVEDRGYQFADGVYEVAAVCRGRIIDEDGHLVRLKRSLSELQITMPMADGPFALVCREILRQNRVQDGLLYIQVTRGVARRDHPFPEVYLTRFHNRFLQSGFGQELNQKFSLFLYLLIQHLHPL